MPHLIALGKTGSGRILRATTICWHVWLVVLPGCKEDDAVAVAPTRVKVVTMEIVDFAPSINLTGVIAAQVRTDLSFRLSGKISERLVNVGDHVVLNQVLAKLAPDEQQSELVSAQAGVASAETSVRRRRPPSSARRIFSPPPPAWA
jgi:multidrug efflux pump subunit AcrA (membrane-fusion protein)